MIPQRIHLDNFLAYGDADLDLRGVELACLSGPNGAGKSSVIDGLTWGLFGEARGRTEDELFRNSATQMAVEVEFALDGNVYRVARRRKRTGSRPGQTALDFEMSNGADGWSKLTDATIKETQATIIRTLGTDYDTFINASLLLQGRSDEFARKPATERKQVLANILRLEVYDRLQDAAKTRRNLAEAGIANLRTWLDDAASRLAERETIEQDLAASERAAEGARQRLTEAEANLQGRKESLAVLRARAQALAEAQGRLSRLTERERKAQAELDEQRGRHVLAQSSLETADEIERKYRRYQELQGLIQGLRDHGIKREALQSRIETRTWERDRLKGTTPDLEALTDCPFCQQTLASDEAKASVREQYAEGLSMIEIADRDIGRLKAEVAAVPDTAALPNLEAEYGSLAGIVEKYAGLGAARERLTSAESAIKRLEGDLGTIAEDLLDAQEVVDGADVDQAALQAEESEVATLQADCDRLRREEREVADRLAGLRQRAADLDELQSQYDERQAQLEASATEAQLYTDVAAACGRSGVQAMIIDAAIPELAQVAGGILGQLTDGRMSLDLTTQRLTQAGATRETLDIEIGDESGIRAYEMFSGGERFRIDFALHLALAEVLSRRAGAAIQLLIIDEGFGTQDAEGRTRLLEALTLARERFAMVLAISHVDEFREAFPVRIEIQPSPTGSVATVV